MKNLKHKLNLQLFADEAKTADELKTLQDELETKQAELDAKETELVNRSKELEEKERTLNEKEQRISDDKADSVKLTETIKQTYETKLSEQEASFKQRLADREEIIKQLVSGNVEKPQPKAFELLNEKRKASRKANYPLK